VPQLSQKDQDYISLAPYLTDYYTYRPTLENFAQAIADRKSKPVDRVTLQKVIKDNYSKITATEKQQLHIEALLSEDTFTIITAHQPSLLGGPLYYVYKICSVINLVAQLQLKYPEYHFVPVFINGSEDHDFDEIDHFNIYGKTLRWEREASGPVGRLSTEGLSVVIDQAADILDDSEHSKRIIDVFKDSLKHSSNYNDFVFRYVNELFGKYGLLVVNTDNKELKRNFAPIMKQEITKRPSQQLVMDTQQMLEQHGFKAQAYPRDINLFYLGNGDRQRITYEEGKYAIVDTEQSYTEAEILQMVDEHPEDFSPNVVMRPLYQEVTLPNLAYVGGGGEIAYWLERKEQFAHYDVHYPMLIRRNSALLLDKGSSKNLTKLDLNVSDMFEHEDQIISSYLLSAVSEDITIDEELEQMQAAYESIAEKAAPHDPGLKKAILAEMTKQLKQVNNLGGRIKRTIKAREENNVSKIKKVKEKLFPGNGLQERSDNFIQYYSKLGPDFFDFLVTNLDPLTAEFAIIEL